MRFYRAEWMLGLPLAVLMAACGPSAGGGGGDHDGGLPFQDGQVGRDASGIPFGDASTCESTCDQAGAVVCSTMSTRVKQCNTVAPGCLRWEVADDCASQGMLCDATLDPPACILPPSCSDGILNQDETDIDCGGSCPDCDPGAGCSAPEDCVSGLCEGGVCLLCSPGNHRCRGNWLDVCATDGLSWTPDVHCNASGGEGCDADAGTCHALSPIGNGPDNPTGWYYEFAYFTSSNAPLQGQIWDVDSFGDLIYANRDGSHVDVYQVTLLDSDGDGKLEPNQHPDNPDNTGPIEERVLTFVQTYNVPIGGQNSNELYITPTDIYFLGSNAIQQFVMATGATTPVVSMPTGGYSGGFQVIGFDDVSNTWYSATSQRQVWGYDASEGEWVWEFTYPNLAGSHNDGMEDVVDPNTGTSYLYITDMTSDFIAQYHEDETGRWTQLNLFQYSQPQGDYVEGMGFGALNHFWCGGGSVLYEVGGGDLQQFTEPFDPTNQ